MPAGGMPCFGDGTEGGGREKLRAERSDGAWKARRRSQFAAGGGFDVVDEEIYDRKDQVDDGAVQGRNLAFGRDAIVQAAEPGDDGLDRVG